MRSVLALGLVLLLSRLAVADTPDANAGRKLFAEGQELYTKSDYDGAAAKFELAYAKDPDPAYLFNLAQAHRLGKKCARAASDYRTFLSLVTDPPNEAEVKIYIRDMDECSPKKPDPIVKPPIQPPPDPASVVHGEGHSRRKLAGLVLGIGGAAVIGVAGFFTWDTSFLAGRRDDLKRSCEPTSSCVATELVDYDSRGHRARTIAITSWAVGGAALVAGGVVFLSSRGHEQPTLTIAPTANGAMIVGQF